MEVLYSSQEYIEIQKTESTIKSNTGYGRIHSNKDKKCRKLVFSYMVAFSILNVLTRGYY